MKTHFVVTGVIKHKDKFLVDFKWVTKKELNKYPFVPGLTKDIESLGLK